MVNTSTMEKILAVDNGGYIDFSYMGGSYEYAFQREKLFEVLYKRCFCENNEYSLIAGPGKMELNGYEAPSEDLFGEYIERYCFECEDNIYVSAIKRLKKYGRLWEVSLFNDEVIDLASHEDVNISDECMEQIRSMDHVKAILPENADVEGFKRAFPDLNQQFSDWLCYDPLNENGTLIVYAYESDSIGKLFGFDTDDIKLLGFREQLTKEFIGFNSTVSDGKFFMYLIFGNIEDQMASLEDMPDNFIGLIALLEQMMEKYVDSNNIVQFNQEDEQCRVA